MGSAVEFPGNLQKCLSEVIRDYFQKRIGAYGGIIFVKNEKKIPEEMHEIILGGIPQEISKEISREIF